MARLLDLIHRHGLQCPPWVGAQEAWAREQVQFGKFLTDPKLPVIVADNMAEYVYAQTGREVWDWWGDFPNIAPPFPTFWVEYRRPSKVVSDVLGVKDSRDVLPKWQGYLFNTIDLDTLFKQREDDTPTRRRRTAMRIITDKVIISQLDEVSKRILAGELNGKPFEDMGRLERLAFETGLMSRTHEELKTLFGAINHPHAELIVNSEPRWVVIVNGYAAIDNDQPLGPVTNFMFVVDKMGRNVITPVMSLPYVGDNADREDLRQFSSYLSGGELWPVLMALSLLHCKNVRVADVQPEPKLSRAFRKRSGHELVTYKELAIRPMRTVQVSGRGAPTSEHYRLHIQRGHFKTYTKAAPLFGRHVGTWWWDDKAIGDESLGRVEKSYKVLEPAQ